MNDIELTRPLLRYHGGKWMLAEWIIGNFPDHRSYVEPFGGAASVLMRKPRSYAEVYNDLDGELVNLFRVARDCGDELRRRLELTPFAREEFVSSYEPDDNPIEQARKTIARSFMGFGSNAHNKATGFRANSNKSGTTPARDWMNYPRAFEAIINRLRGVVIENRHAIELIEQQDSEQTLFYVDPPYVAETRDAGEDYAFEMTADDHRQMADALRSVKGMVVLSGYGCALYDELFGDWRRIERAALADGARARVEVLWLSPNCPETQQRLFA